MLFMAPLMRKKPPSDLSRPRRGYADDILLSATENSPEETSKALKEDLTRSLKWCKNNGLDIDKKKTGLIHFSRVRAHDNPVIEFGP